MEVCSAVSGETLAFLDPEESPASRHQSSASILGVKKTGGMRQRLQCPWGKTPASQDDIFQYSVTDVSDFCFQSQLSHVATYGGMPYGWSPSSLDRNRMAHATNGNGTGGARKGSGNGKKGAKSVYTAPSPAPIPLPDGGLLQSWGSAPADVDETQLLRDIQDAMPL